MSAPPARRFEWMYVRDVNANAALARQYRLDSWQLAGPRLDESVDRWERDPAQAIADNDSDFVILRRETFLRCWPEMQRGDLWICSAKEEDPGDLLQPPWLARPASTEKKVVIREVPPTLVFVCSVVPGDGRLCTVEYRTLAGEKALVFKDAPMPPKEDRLVIFLASALAARGKLLSQNQEVHVVMEGAGLLGATTAREAREILDSP